MKANFITKFSGILLISFVAGFNVFGQDRNAVIEAYNQGAKTVQTDVPAAIKAFENVITLSDKVGEPAADLKQKAIQILPGLYLKNAADKINQKKPAPEAVKAAKDAVAAAEKYGNPSQKDNAQKILIQAYNNLGTQFFTQNDFEKALLTFDSVLAINPGYSQAIYNKALIYRKQDNSDAFGQTIDQYIEKVNDPGKAKQASAVALEYFRAAGSKANQANELDKALDLLNKAAKYGDDKDVFYFFADVHNKKKDFDKGLEYAKKGLDLETGTAEAKAKFYFQLGLAQEGKGQTTEACNSFKSAMFGPFAAPSKVKRTNLKCK
jgi:tetratricopeptide (TPR) repeat protein